MNARLLALLQEADGFVSGERLSRELGISRTAVWKRIRRLEDEGFVFETVPRLGYRLLRAPQRLSPERLLGLLADVPFVASVKVLESTASTQNEAYRAVLDGAGEGLVIIAEEQTMGRGRLGRSFFSPPGAGVYMSFLLRPDIPPGRAPQITLLLSAALCRAVRKAAGLDAKIKWPNDIVIRGRKASGILVETILEADRVRMMIAGIGVNVNTLRAQFPPELAGKVTSLREECGREVPREELIAAFFAEFARLYALYRTEGFAPIKTLWEAHADTLGRRVRVETPQGTFEGMAEGVTEEGALLLRDGAGRLRPVYSGDLGPAAELEAAEE